MIRSLVYHKKGMCVMLLLILLAAAALIGRIGYLMIGAEDHYGALAKEIQERERSIKAGRGVIYDRNKTAIATNKPVCTISVIYSQIEEPERVIEVLSKELGLSEERVRKRVEKVSSIERIKANVEKEVADRIRTYELAGVMVDEDYNRFYPYGTLASKVIGFTGGDNQGIIGLEVAYEEMLKGTDGTILTLTTASGVEIDGAAENRIEPVNGKDLYVSLDVNIQMYAEQEAKKVMESKEAKQVSIIILNPQNGEIYAMVNVPEFDLNHPYDLSVLQQEWQIETSEEEVKATSGDGSEMDQYNNMWRNGCISDTYEPGSIFKIITATAALEEQKVTVADQFFCPGYKVVEDRSIHCHKRAGHGAETFKEGLMNSCNPVFMEIGARVGAESMYDYYRQLGLFERTGIDLPGEANSIFHKLENVGAVELATMTFGQSFQITPLQLLSAVSSVVNGGRRIVPHFGVKVVNEEQGTVEELLYEEKETGISTVTSETMKTLLEAVVSEGSGKNGAIEGYALGGKTATSQKLPRSSKKYISSYLCFAPANDPVVMGIVLIDEPTGVYYGGTIAAPVMERIFENILPYLGIERTLPVEEVDPQKEES